MIKKKAGISKPIICSRCGKRVGYVKLKWRFNAKLIGWGIVIAFGTSFVAQLFSDYIIRIVLNNHI